MGNCGAASTVSSEDRKVSESIEKDLRNAKKISLSETKVLLLGTGEAGKTTVIKQVRFSYAGGFKQDELNMQRTVIHGNIISSMSILAKSLLMEEKLEDPQHIELARFISSPDNSMKQELTDEIVECVKTLWQLEIFKKTFENQSNLQILDSACYFFDKIDEIHSPNYNPSNQDVLYSRVRTIGINEITFKLTGTLIRLVDVGGQRSERRKWIHCFEDVTVIFYICAMNEYDQVLREDETTNRLQEAMNLFQEISTCDWFSQTPIMLFLNKSDLFREKIKRVPLKSFFANYTGENDYNLATKYLSDEFTTLSRKTSGLYVHVTCATDTESIKFVFKAFQDIFLNQRLQSLSLD